MKAYHLYVTTYMATAWLLTAFVLSMLFEGTAISVLSIIYLILTTVTEGRRIPKSRVNSVCFASLLKQI